ncbi:hypothetical protein [uncultured Draconibacterium sp.]|uniref:hypothetical protein n=1 Tax=uncultured Draconibacterium sp. TaxID=1573823 RepID=UPI0029C748AC|nr:hypothetical protein [uncultured Draconibacterium sp.]
MEKIITALKTNFDLLDFLYVHYKIPNKKEDNFFFDAEYIENKDDVDLEYIKLHSNEFNWETLCYNYHTPDLEDLIDTNYKEINWFKISDNPKIIWTERLLNKYWEVIYVNSIISHSQMYWDEKLVRFIISKHDKDSTKIFWLEKFAIISNIEWNLKMILDFPTSYWIREVINTNTLKLSFEDLRKYKNKLNSEIFKYLQVSSNLLWTIEEIQEFKELLNFQILSKSKNVDWSNELILIFYEKLDFELMSKNQSISIDEFIINKFKKLWNFKSLSSNSNVKWSVELLKAFVSEFDLNMALQFDVIGIDDVFIHEHRDYIDWGTGCGNYIYSPAPIARYNHIPISVQTLSEKATNWEVGHCKPYWDEKGPYEGEWHQFSSNKYLTPLHLEKFAEKLSWDLISCNEFISITNELLLKHSDKWIWSKVLSRNDFKLEHFYAIHQYLNFEILSAHRLKIFEILEPDKNAVYTHIKDNVEVVGDFRHSLRTPNYRHYSDYENDAKQLFKVKREIITKQCERANSEHSEIKKYDERYGIDAQDAVYYDKIHYWLRKYFKVFEEISHVSDSYKRERGYTPEREIQIFFDLYLKAEEDFKKNYFDIYKHK